MGAAYLGTSLAPTPGPSAGPRLPVGLTKILGFFGATLGGALGWWLGDALGVMTAFLLSMVGTGVGMYAGARVARRYWG